MVHDIFSTGQNGAARAVVAALPALEEAASRELAGSGRPPAPERDASGAAPTGHLPAPTQVREPESPVPPARPEGRRRWPSRREQQALRAMVDSIDSIDAYVETAGAGDPMRIEEPGVLQDAVQRRLGMIGEACEHISPTTRADMQTVTVEWRQVNWRGMNGLRNLLVHHYGQIDNRILATSVRDHLPVLRRAVGTRLAPPGSPDLAAPFERGG